MIIRNNREAVLKQIKVQELLLEENTYRCVDSHIQSFYADLPFKSKSKITYELLIDYYGEKLICEVYQGTDKAYDWLMNQPETAISSDITCRKTRKTCLKGIDIEITFTIYCDLPAADFQTLDMLGKVHRSITKSRVTESIYCEV